MGILALVEYSLIKELCEQIKKDKKTFTGKVKEKDFEDEGSAETDHKISEIRRLLLSGKRKSEKNKKNGKRKRKGKIEEPKRFTQRPSSSSDTGSDTGSSTGSDSDISTESEFIDADSAGRGQSGKSDDIRSDTK